MCLLLFYSECLNIHIFKMENENSELKRLTYLSLPILNFAYFVPFRSNFKSNSGKRFSEIEGWFVLTCHVEEFAIHIYAATFPAFSFYEEAPRYPNLISRKKSIVWNGYLP